MKRVTANKERVHNSVSKWAQTLFAVVCAAFEGGVVCFLLHYKRAGIVEKNLARARVHENEDLFPDFRSDKQNVN
jgi:hypothetical protein